MFSPDKWFTNPSTGFYSKTIDQSLRFNEADNPVLSTTQTSGTTTTWTFSAWIKRSRLDSALQSGGNAGQDPIFCVGENNTNDVIMYFQQYGGGAVDCLDIIIRDGGAIRARFVTSRVFRDTSAWYNIQLTCDFTNSTQGDRLRLYVNGVRETAFGTETYPSDASQITIVNNNSYTARIGQLRADSAYFAGYMAEMHLVDGSALEPTSFGEFKGGVWTCKNYSGSHGTAGWYLPFDDSSAIGDDESANTNDFSVSGLTASDVVLDSPTNNFATLNPLDLSGSIPSFFEGNLKVERSGNYAQAYSSFSFDSGKWYAEYLIDTGNADPGVIAGTANAGANRYLGQDTFTYGYYRDGRKINSGVYTSHGAGYTVAADGSGDVVGIYIDADNGNIYISVNGTLTNSGTAIFTGVTGPFRFAADTENGGFVAVNFGQDDTFAGLKTSGSAAASDDNGIGLFYDAIALSGYLALCSANLPEPAIGPNSDEQADDYFNTVLWSGDGSSSNAITGVGFQPDAVWLKGRNVTYDHQFFNSVTGATKFLKTNTTGAEITSATSLLSFDSDGFTYGSNLSGNQSGKTYAAWNWKAGGTAVSNSDGSITSSVSAAPDAGFAVGTYTGNATAGATIGHSLGAIPEMVIAKRRTNARDWSVYHKDQSATPTNAYLLLNSTAAVGSGATAWNNGTFTSDVFTIGSHELVNASGDSYVFYAFKGIEGYSAVGSYVGNGSADGPFVYTGLRPAFVLLKISSTTNNWFIYDNKREGYNQENDTLSPNDTSAEDNSYKLDLVSNGFKIRGSNNAHNHSGQTFVYLCFAEQPFKFANAR